MSSRDPKVWMWAEACEFLERAERVQRQFFQLGVSPSRRPNWQPPVDIFETEAEVVIMIALPGVTPEDLSIAVDGGHVVISGERRIPAEGRRAAIHRLEIPHGHFERRIELPPGRYAMTGQDLAYGCLVLSLRKLGY